MLRCCPSQVKQHQYHFQYYRFIRNTHPTYIIFQGKVVTELSLFQKTFSIIKIKVYIRYIDLYSGFIIKNIMFYNDISNENKIEIFLSLWIMLYKVSFDNQRFELKYDLIINSPSLYSFCKYCDFLYNKPGLIIQSMIEVL